MIKASDSDGDVSGVVAIGASAGGVEALSNLAGGLSPELPYAYLVAVHMPAGAPSVLARIIDRKGLLPAVTAEHGMSLQPAHIYVARPSRHLLVVDHRVVLSDGPTENGHRPAINALFRSVALAFGPHAVGVLLSGVLDDGVRGLAAIRSRGGITIGQSPDDALFPAMPAAARDAGVLDHQVAAADMGAVLRKLSRRDLEDIEDIEDMEGIDGIEGTEQRNLQPDLKAVAGMELENRIAMSSRFSSDFDSQELGPPSGYTCPDCNGSLASLGGGSFRCRVGHAWTRDALLAAHDDEVDTALWVALRSLQEKAKLARQLAETVGHGLLYRRYIAMAEETERALAVLSRGLSDSGHRHGDTGDLDG